jgi:hypothetical protein
MARKYLSVSKTLHKALEMYAKDSKSTLKSAVERLIDLGLRFEREAQQRSENEKIFNQRLPEFQYTIGRPRRTYLAISPETYEKVKSYAERKQLKMVEGAWRLLFIGMQYSLEGNPRNDPEFKNAMEIGKIIEDHLEKKYGLPVAKYLNTEGQSSLEERLIKMLQHQARSITERGHQRNKISDSTINFIKIMEVKYAAMLLGAQQTIEKLEKRNEFLEREIARRGKVFKPQGADSVEKADFSSQSDESSNVIQTEWPSLE